MICAVCGNPCRGTCRKCGAALCAAHKPASPRARCAVCKRQPAGAVQAIQAQPHVSPVSAPSRGTPASVPSPGHAVPLAQLSLTEQLAWLAERRDRLRAKQRRERAYLDRRAARGTHTPTDDAYEADARLESDLLEALDLLAACLQQGIPGGKPGPGSSSTGPAGASSTYAGDTSMLFPLPGPHDKLQP